MQPKATPQFKTFEDLEVYQLACEFRKATDAVTRRLPGSEEIELADDGADPFAEEPL